MRLRCPKPWKFGRRWIGPFRVISRKGVNYTIRSPEGRDRVVHHNNLKACVLPPGTGTTHYPIPEAEGTDTAVAATGGPGGPWPPLFAKMKFAHLYFTVLR